MKKHFLFIFLAAAAAFALTACESKSQSTPYAALHKLMIRTSSEGHTDTLQYLDTVQIADTIRQSFYIDGGFNVLTYFEASADASALNISLEVDSAVKTLLTTGTDLEHGKMVFDPQKYVIAVTGKLKMVPLKSGKLPFVITVANDAGKDYSPRSLEYALIVK